MRSLPFPAGCFELITNFFTGFGYFETDQQHQQLLDEWARITTGGGYFFLDYLNKNSVVSGLQPHSKDDFPAFTVEQFRSITEGNLRVEKEIVIKEKNTNREYHYLESVRMYASDELKEMIEKSGFKILDVFGDFDGSSLQDSSDRLLVLSKRS
jgi:ubiquinone/menaquinone biosynthesis C-methylase UbiE